jgi:uncharacterized caspase-like protein
VAVIFLAGHGINDGGYYFLSYDADPGNKLLTLLSDSVLRDVLVRLPGQVLLFLDTCRAGSLLGTGLASTDQDLRRLVDVRQFVNLMTFSHNGVVVFSATQSGELSQESPDWGHGAFTKALLDALGGAADGNGDGDITTSELEGYLASTVRRMTGGAQTPVAAKPGGVPDLVVAPGVRR